MRAGALLIGAALTSATAPPDAGRLREVAAVASGRISARWGVAPKIRFVDGADIRWFEDRIDIGTEGLRRLTTGLSEKSAEVAVQWMIAHEVWHAVQFRRGAGAPQDLQLARMRECEADVMASHAVMDQEFAAQGLRTEEGAAQRLGDAVAGVVDTAQALEAGAGVDGDHPTGDQRRTAIRFGVGRALAERYPDLATEEDRRLARDRLLRVFDVMSGEPAPQWATRTCRGILHAGDGVASLATDAATVKWSTAADAPFVDYRIPYRNVGRAPIRAELHVRTMSVPRDRRGDTDRWRVADTRRHTFDLAPGQIHEVTGRLQWVATDELMPRLVYPLSRESLYQAVVLRSTAAAAPAPVQLIGADAELTELRAALDPILTSAAYAFSTAEANCTPARGERSCELRIPIPGVEEAAVEHAGNGASDVTIWIYRGDSVEQAQAAYSRFRNSLRALYPAAKYRETTREGRHSLSLSPTADTTMSLSHFSSARGQRVLAVIEPTVVD
ncbi:MAG TPA: hypothetical protein VF592_00340 [Sphingomonas sp.]|uniref:hypothetical protein n=1 Tax=Sphingomonas sp. TaxID=28214 RepID=UPI002EDABD4F